MSLNITKNQSLKAFNTFAFDQKAELFAYVDTERDIEEAVRYAQRKRLKLFVLGGGSNIVMVDDIPGLVIRLTNQAVTLSRKNKHETIVTAGAGANWHTLVNDTLAAGVSGLENLSLIPGSVGAAPIQNIGAYGVEVKDRIQRVRALHVPDMQWVNLTNRECEFSYRHSHFKDHPDDFIISEVDFRLGDCHALNTSYGSLETHLQSRNLEHPTARQVSESVIAVRQSRLPDPAKTGNAGSFFHNPVVSAEHKENLQHGFRRYPAINNPTGRTKLAAAWLIDNLGYKGTVRDGVGVHDAQALVLVNTGSGDGRKIMALANEIVGNVLTTYNVTLSIEPRIVG